MSRTFFKLHYDYLQNPAYREFMRSPANVTYTLLLANVFRPTKDMARTRENEELANLYSQHWLVCHISTRELHRQFPERHWTRIASDIRWLADQGLVQIYTWERNQKPLLKLGSWQNYRHPDGRVQWIETYYVDTIFGPPGIA